MRKFLLATALLCAVSTGACDLVTDPDPLEDFAFQQLEPASGFEESMDAAGFFGEILAVGQFEAPTGCYELNGSFSQSGSTLNLKVTASQRSSTGCAAVPTGYRWSAAIRHLDSGTYDFRVTHAFRNNERPDNVLTTRITVR